MLPSALAELAAKLLQEPVLPDTEIILRHGEEQQYISVRGGHVNEGYEGRLGSLMFLRDLTEVRRLEAEVRRREKLAAASPEQVRFSFISGMAAGDLYIALFIHQISIHSKIILITFQQGLEGIYPESHTDHTHNCSPVIHDTAVDKDSHLIPGPLNLIIIDLYAIIRILIQKIIKPVIFRITFL